MEQHERLLQVLGTILIAAFGTLLLAVRYVSRLAVGWKDALLLAALFNLVAVVVRITTMIGLVDQTEGRTLNGLVAAVFVSALLVSIVGNLKSHSNVRA